MFSSEKSDLSDKKIHNYIFDISNHFVSLSDTDRITERVMANLFTPEFFASVCRASTLDNVACRFNMGCGLESVEG